MNTSWKNANFLSESFTLRNPLSMEKSIIIRPQIDLIVTGDRYTNGLHSVGASWCWHWHGSQNRCIKLEFADSKTQKEMCFTYYITGSDGIHIQTLKLMVDEHITISTKFNQWNLRNRQYSTRWWKIRLHANSKNSTANKCEHFKLICLIT